jgi:hypothetical protein
MTQMKKKITGNEMTKNNNNNDLLLAMQQEITEVNVKTLYKIKTLQT